MFLVFFLFCSMLEGELFKVEEILDDRIRVDRVWVRPNAEGLLMFKMVLNPRQKLTLT